MVFDRLAAQCFQPLLPGAQNRVMNARGVLMLAVRRGQGKQHVPKLPGNPAGNLVDGLVAKGFHEETDGLAGITNDAGASGFITINELVRHFRNGRGCFFLGLEGGFLAAVLTEESSACTGVKAA